MTLSILYVGEMGAGQTSNDRADALARLGAQITTISATRRNGIGGRVEYKLAGMTQLGPYVANLNRRARELIATHSFDIIWLDKGWLIEPRTLGLAKKTGLTVVLFNNDNPWGEHERGKWRLLLGGLEYVDYVLTPRISTDSLYLSAGAKHVVYVDFAYEKSRHFATSGPVGALGNGACFIGTALADGACVRPHRTILIADLIRAFPRQVSVFGYGWENYLKGVEDRALKIGGEQLGDDYRRAIWNSWLNFAFVTHDNWEESSHKSFEIAACGGCLLAERTPRLQASFLEDQEAVFFSTQEELLQKTGVLLSDRRMRDRIAAGGQRRALSSGYDNDSRLAGVLFSLFNAGQKSRWV